MTYLYFIFSSVVGFGISYSYRKRTVFSICLYLGIMVLSIGLYFAYFEQAFAKAYGGNMNITLKENISLINAYWRDSSLMVLTYDSTTNSCVLKEESKFGAIEGTVTFKKCR